MIGRLNRDSGSWAVRKQKHVEPHAVRNQKPGGSETPGHNAIPALGLAIFRARRELARLEARDRCLQARYPGENPPRESIAVARNHLHELEEKLRRQRELRELVNDDRPEPRASMDIKSMVLAVVGSLFRLLLPIIPLVVLVPLAGWEFTRGLILEYWVALLALIGLSHWSLYRTKRKRPQQSGQRF